METMLLSKLTLAIPRPSHEKVQAVVVLTENVGSSNPAAIDYQHWQLWSHQHGDDTPQSRFMGMLMSATWYVSAGRDQAACGLCVQPASPAAGSQLMSLIRG